MNLIGIILNAFVAGQQCTLAFDAYLGGRDYIVSVFAAGMFLFAACINAYSLKKFHMK